MLSRREFMQMAAVTAGIYGTTSNWNRAAAKQAMVQDDLLKFDSKGQVTLLHITDMHAQLKPLYYDTRHATPSDSRCLVLGMGLMHLLVDNRLAEFHSELELTSDADRADAHVQFVVALETSLMEGNYSKVLLARSSAPTHFTWFMDQMVDSIRDNIADVTESAYTSITLAEAQRLLHFDSAAALGSYIDEGRPKWTVEADRIMFEQAEQRVGCKDIPSLQLIRESLLYATELDRIV